MIEIKKLPELGKDQNFFFWKKYRIKQPKLTDKYSASKIGTSISAISFLKCCIKSKTYSVNK